MGFEVAAIARGADKEELARKLGAHHYIEWPRGRVDAKVTRFVKGRLLRAKMARSTRSGADVAHGRIGADQLGQKLDDDARPQG
jgi:D-arabinose 1-dehydrogenase-like Zn-dependent alcohol dehydrogenase